MAERPLEQSICALTTSGDARRLLLFDERRYRHINDPRKGWLVANPTPSDKVMLSTCFELGILWTLAILRGPGAERLTKREAFKA